MILIYALLSPICRKPWVSDDLGGITPQTDIIKTDLTIKETNCLNCNQLMPSLSLPARASEQGNVIGLVSVYIYIYIYQRVR